MFSEFLLTESLELVEGKEASGPAGLTGEESFDCAREAEVHLLISYIRERLHLGVPSKKQAG